MRKEMERDEGLSRLSRGTRWLTAGAVVSAGCLSIAVAETLPGRSSAATTRPSPAVAPSATTPSTDAPSTTEPVNDGDADNGGATAPVVTAPPQTAAPQTLAPPTTPPTTAYTAPVVSSGGS